MPYSISYPTLDADEYYQFAADAWLQLGIDRDTPGSQVVNEVVARVNRVFTAGWNVPGYLPEMEPQVFEHYSEAVEFLHSEVEFLREEEEEDDAFLCVHTALHNLAHEVDIDVYTADASIVFWIAG